MKIRLSAALGALALLQFLGASPVCAAEGPRDVHALLQQGKAAEALVLATRLVEAQPRDPEARFARGVALAELGRQDEAISVFLKLTQDFPSQPEPYNNLAVLYAQQKQYDKARATLESALRTHPSYAVAHQNLGDLYARLASQAYEKALQADSTRSTETPTRLALITELKSDAARTAAGPRASTAAAVPPAAPKGPALAAASGSPTIAAAPPTTAVAPPPAPPAAAPAKPVAPSAPGSAAPAVAATPNPPAIPQTTAGAPPQPAAAPRAASVPVPPAAEAPAGAASQPGADTVVAERKPAAAPEKAAQDAVLRSVQGWAQAWSRKDVKSYLAAYDKDFEVPDGRARAVWERERQQRVGKAGAITVEVDNPRISVNGDRATVRFQQHYRSSGFNGSTNKTLELVRRGDQWKIRRETVGG